MRIHAVDGTYELYRAEYSKRPRKIVKRGGVDVDVTATVGLLASMVALLADTNERVTHLAYAFDNPIRSFRNDLFPPYKDDTGVPEGLRAQFDLVEAAVASLGVRAFRMVEHEADDALGTLASFSTETNGIEVRLMTPDKDLGQCLRAERVVVVDRARERVLTEAELREKRGFSPALMPDFLALTGDPQDGIPGLVGFGEKSVAALLAAFGPLESIPDDPAAWPKSVRGRERLAEELRARREDARLYKKLATLVTDVPLGVTLDDLRVPETVPETFASFVHELGTDDLARRATDVFAKRAKWLA